MAGVSEAPNRRARHAAAAAGTAPVEPAVEASAERAAIERDPEESGIPAPTAPVLPVEALPDDAAVLPEPTLTAEPGAPAPIVTAAPPLAVEPSAVDVVQAQAEAARADAGIGPAPDREGDHLAAAGQPVLTIEGGAADVRRSMLGIDQIGQDVLRDDDAFYLGRETVDGHIVMTLDEIAHGLELLGQRDPTAMDIIRTRFFAEDAPAYPFPADRPHTVTIVEVVGPVQGRRRSGMLFGPQARRFPIDAISAAEYDALRADPLLTVGVSTVDASELDAVIAGTGT